AGGDCDEDFEFLGTIQSLPATVGFIGDWVVSGRIVHVSASTEIKRPSGVQVMVGVGVDIQGCLQTDGSVFATEIGIKPGGGGGSNNSFSGTVEELPNSVGRIGDWKVSGITVHVTTATFIKQENGQVAIGSKVDVEGSQRSDNSVDAFKIEV